MAEVLNKDNGKFTFKVNGFQLESERNKIVVSDILSIAKKAGAMPGEPEEYILQGDKGQYGWNDWVDLLEDSVFVTIRNTATPVA